MKNLFLIEFLSSILLQFLLPRQFLFRKLLSVEVSCERFLLLIAEGSDEIKTFQNGFIKDSVSLKSKPPTSMIFSAQYLEPDRKVKNI